MFVTRLCHSGQTHRPRCCSVTDMGAFEYPMKNSRNGNKEELQSAHMPALVQLIGQSKCSQRTCQHLFNPLANQNAASTHASNCSTHWPIKMQPANMTLYFTLLYFPGTHSWFHVEVFLYKYWILLSLTQAADMVMHPAEFFEESLKVMKVICKGQNIKITIDVTHGSDILITNMPPANRYPFLRCTITHQT